MRFYLAGTGAGDELSMDSYAMLSLVLLQETMNHSQCTLLEVVVRQVRNQEVSVIVETSVCI